MLSLSKTKHQPTDHTNTKTRTTQEHAKKAWFNRNYQIKVQLLIINLKLGIPDPKKLT